MKEVTFLGRSYSVPDWTKYITVTSHGVIQAWNCEPIERSGQWDYPCLEAFAITLPSLQKPVCEEVK